MKKDCLICTKEFKTKPSHYNRRHYCSYKCYWQSLKGANLNENNPDWKGDNVTYSGLHAWVNAKLGAPRKCDNCDITTAKKYEWANISKEYKRNLTDWRRLCVSCHRKYDGHDKKRLETIRRQYA